MAGETTPAIGPDGTPLDVPTSQVANLAAQGGHVQAPEEAAAQDAARAQAQKPVTLGDAAKWGLEAGAAWDHAGARGFGEAFGVPLDSLAANTGDVIGHGAGDAVRRELGHLDQAHPIVSGAGNVAGNVGGAYVAGALAGPAVTGAGAKGALGLAQRMAVGGVENVLQATTHDFNEADLGDANVNAQKLLADMPSRFFVGSVLTGAFEGGMYGVEKGIAQFSKAARPALEGAASRAVGRELGMHGEEGLVNGARVRELNGGEVPRTRGDIGELLTRAQQGERAATGARFDASEADLAGRGSAMRASADASGIEGVRAAESDAATLRGDSDVLARGMVGDAERAASERIGAASGKADAALAHPALSPEFAETAQAQARAAEQHAAEVTDAFQQQMKGLKDEHAQALEDYRGLHDEHTDIEKQMRELHKEIDANSAEQIANHTKSKFSEIKALHREGLTGEASARAQALNQGKDFLLNQVAEQSGNPALAAEAKRLTTLRSQIEEARDLAGQHLEQVQASIRETQDAARAELQRAKLAAKQTAASLEKVPETVTRARAAADSAAANLEKVKAEQEAFLQRAQTKGAKAVATAEKRAMARLTAAKEAHEAALAAVDKTIEKEAKAMTAARKRETGSTMVDDLVKGFEAKGKAPAEPLVSPNATLAAGYSLLHGNVLGAGTALTGSLMANAAKNAGNLTAARMMRGISTRLSAVDAAIRSGAASVLGRHVAHSAAAAAPAAMRAAADVHVAKFEDVQRSLLEAQANPQVLEQRLNATMGHTAKVAPETYQAALQTTQRAQSYLLSVMPVAQRDPYTLTPNLEPGHVDPVDQYEFMQRVSAVDDPLSVFSATKAGDISALQVEAVQNVYPELFDQMRNEVRYQTMLLKTPVDYDKSIHVGTLLGITTDETLEPDFQTSQQKAFAQKADAGAPIGGKSPPSPPPGNMTKMLTSGSQAVEGGIQ